MPRLPPPKVTLFIEKTGFFEGRGSKSERATNGDPKVAGNARENTVFGADRRKPWHSRYLIYLSAEITALGLKKASRLAWQHRFTCEGKCQGHGSSPQRASVLGCIRARGAWRGNGSTRPVLKHGPASLTCMQACGCVRLLCTMKVTAGTVLACQRCCSTCSGVAVSRRTALVGLRVRGRAKVTVFIEK